MGSLIAPFDEKGILQTHTTSGDSLTKKSGKNKNSVDSDMFLTLLVAEMQNQDPLEPTSNTEWVSQYATFTQVQKMSEMAESIDVLRANNLIGKEVIMKTTSESTGEVNYTQGIVDFVEVENGKPLLVIDDKKYSISDLDTIVSSQYSAAYEKYSTFKKMIDALPDVAVANRSYENVIQGALDFYNTMDDYQKNYMKIYGSDQLEKFTEWKLELENMGVKFKDTSVEEEEEKTTLDDILESFNTKMNAILDKLNAMSENKVETDKSDTNTGDKTDETTGDKTSGNNTGNTEEVTDSKTDENGTGKAEEATGDKTSGNNTGKTEEVTDNKADGNNTGNTEQVTGSQPGAGNTDGTGDSADNTTGDNSTGSTEQVTGGQSGAGNTDSIGEITDNTEQATGSQPGAGNTDSTGEITDNNTGVGSTEQVTGSQPDGETAGNQPEGE